MELELKDIINHYVGQPCLTPWGVLYLTRVQSKGKYKYWFSTEDKRNEDVVRAHSCAGRSFYLSEIKLLLRPWSDLKPIEIKHLNWDDQYLYWAKKNKKGEIKITYQEQMPVTLRPNEYSFLCKLGIDLFHAIKTGIAMDVTGPIESLFARNVTQVCRYHSKYRKDTCPFCVPVKEINADEVTAEFDHKPTYTYSGNVAYLKHLNCTCPNCKERFEVKALESLMAKRKPE